MAISKEIHNFKEQQPQSPIRKSEIPQIVSDLTAARSKYEYHYTPPKRTKCCFKTNESMMLTVGAVSVLFFLLIVFGVVYPNLNK